MNNIIKYGYLYNEELDVYIVRRLDDDIIDYIPDALFEQLILEETTRRPDISIVYDLERCINYDSDYMNIIVDFQGRDYTPNQIDDMVKNTIIKENHNENNITKKILSLFKRRKVK